MFWIARRPEIRRLSGSRRVEVGRFRFIDGLCMPIDGWRPVSETSNLRIGVASKHALNERRGLDESVCARKPRCLEHHVIHIESYLLLSEPRPIVNLRQNFVRLHVSSSSHSVGESGLDLWTGVQRSQHNDGSNGGTGERRSDIGCDSGEAQYVDIEHPARAARVLEVLAAIIPQAEV